MSTASLLTFDNREETVALAKRIQATIDQFHAERGIPDTDIKLVNQACVTVMTAHMSKVDAWTSYILSTNVIQCLLVGIKTERQFLQEEALRGSRSG